jgi:hypothetical protein
MNLTVFFTILTGVAIFVLGQIIVRFLIEPVQEMKRTIGQISHSLTEHANVIQNPGLPKDKMIENTSQHLRNLSAQLESHLYLIPVYELTSKIFSLPSKNNVLKSARSLMGLSNSVYRATEGIYKQNAKRVETICDSLGIYLSEGDRWPKDPQ